jgi:hypothetical protein
MEYNIIVWILIFILCFTAFGVALACIIYTTVSILNFFYYTFTGKYLKIYRRLYHYVNIF